MPVTTSKKMLWTGRGISALVVLLMLLAAIVKLLQVESVIQGFAQAGFAADLVPTVGVIEAACTIIYAIPRTRFLGAILITGLLGGAVATNVRVGDPTWIAPAVLGVLVWLGLFLRDGRLLALVPARS